MFSMECQNGLANALYSNLLELLKINVPSIKELETVVGVKIINAWLVTSNDWMDDFTHMVVF